MSSPQNPTAIPTTTAATTAILAVAAPTPPSDPPAPRKFPAPCWTQEETLALISSYQDKWYSLRRRNLRTADWEAVAEEVTRRCPNHFPAKTSAQCRHKMEKLRKRYRAEKQRINSLPSNGRFFGSSWVFFDLIDSMELGTSSNVSNANHLPNPNNYLHVSNANISKVDLDVKPFMIGKTSGNVSNVNVSEVNGGGGGGDGKKGDLGKYFDEIMLGMGGGSGSGSGGGGGGKGKSQNHEFDVRSAAPHIKFKVKNHHHQQHYNHGHGRGGVDYGVVGGDVNDDFDESDEYVVGDGGRGLMAPPGGFKRKSGPSYDDCDEIFLMRKDSRDGSRAKESVVGEMVTAIKMLGEGLVKMEKMKIDMMRDIEKMRMEMELKRSEMILESQHLIVNAFVEGLKKHKKVKVVDIE